MESVKVSCVSCGGPFGEYQVVHYSGRAYLIEKVPVVAGGIQVDEAMHDAYLLETPLDHPFPPGTGFKYVRSLAPDLVAAGRRQGIPVRGPRTGRRRYKVVYGREEAVARFECGCGRKPRLLDPAAIGRALAHATDGEIHI